MNKNPNTEFQTWNSDMKKKYNRKPKSRSFTAEAFGLSKSPAILQRRCCALGCCLCLVNWSLSLHCCYFIKILHRSSLNTQRASDRPAVLAAVHQQESLTLKTQNTKGIQLWIQSTDPGPSGKSALHLFSLVISWGYMFSTGPLTWSIFIKTIFVVKENRLQQGYSFKWKHYNKQPK